MTTKQAETINWIRIYTENTGYPPTNDVLAAGLGINYAAASQRIHDLQEKNLLGKDRRPKEQR